MTTNPAPLLVGKAEVAGGPEGVAVRVRRDGPVDGFESGPVPLSAQGSFAIALALRKAELNVFRVEPHVADARSAGHSRLIELYETLDKELDH